MLRLIGPRKEYKFHFPAQLLLKSQISKSSSYLFPSTQIYWLNAFPTVSNPILVMKKKANPWLFTDFAIYPKFPDHRIADAQRLTGTAERTKRSETSTKLLKRANGYRISLCLGNFPVERARRSCAIYIPTGISGNFWRKYKSNCSEIVVKFATSLHKWFEIALKAPAKLAYKSLVIGRRSGRMERGADVRSCNREIW